jgi:hypothetical protein
MMIGAAVLYDLFAAISVARGEVLPGLPQARTSGGVLRFFKLQTDH